MKKKWLSLLCLLALLLGTIGPVRTGRAATLPVTSLTMYAGSVYTLRPINAVGKVVFSSSEKSVATVSSDGKITAKGTGRTKITAKTGGFTLKCNVKVKKKSKKSGSRSNPKACPKGDKWLKFDFYMEGKKIGKFRIQFQRFSYGNEAASMAANAGKNVNPAPTATQQYLYFRVRMQYLSGTGTQTVKMSDVFDYNHNVFGAYGAIQLSPVDWGYGLEAYQDMMSVNISPGNDIVAGKAILVPNGFKPVTIRFQTGKNSYTWIKM